MSIFDSLALSWKSIEKIPPIELPPSITPKLTEYVRQIITHEPPELQNLALDAYTNSFHPKPAMGEATLEPTRALSIDSLPKQAQLLPTDYDLRKGLTNGIGLLIDAKNLQLTNKKLGHNVGDSYILTNMESMMEVAESIHAHILIGRLTGDEVVVFLLPQDHNTNLSPYLENSDSGIEDETKINHIIKNIQKERLKGIQDAMHDVELGLHCKAGLLRNIDPSYSDQNRLIDIVSHVTSGIERSLPKLPDNHSVVDTLMLDLIQKAPAKRSEKQLEHILSKLPPSMKAKLDKINKNDPNYAHAVDLAMTATWERLYGETEVMRPEFLFEMAQNLVKQNKGYDIVYIANQDIKKANKHSHDAGDFCLKQTADTIKNVTKHLEYKGDKPNIHLFQSFGSHVALVPRHYTKEFTDLINLQTEQNQPIVHGGFHLDHLTIVATCDNPLSGKDSHNFSLTKENTQEPNTFWQGFIDQVVRPAHYLNEQLEILRRSINPDGTIKNDFFNHYVVRTQNRLKDMAKHHDHINDFIDQYLAYVKRRYPQTLELIEGEYEPASIKTLKGMLNDLIVTGYKTIRPRLMSVTPRQPLPPLWQS